MEFWLYLEWNFDLKWMQIWFLKNTGILNAGWIFSSDFF